MAILRGGRRIGNTDIRIGIPRDRSLDNVQGDRRLRRVQGNPESTIGRVMAAVAQGEGFARPNRFMCDFILPKGVGVEESLEDLFAGVLQSTHNDACRQLTTTINSHKYAVFRVEFEI